MQALGEQLKLRQPEIAYVTVFLKVFYTINSLNTIDTLLLVPMAVFQTTKVAEFGVIFNAHLINVCVNIVKNKFSYDFPNQDFPWQPNNILECEFYLLWTHSCLVIFLPC